MEACLDSIRLLLRPGHSFRQACFHYLIIPNSVKDDVLHCLEPLIVVAYRFPKHVSNTSVCVYIHIYTLPTNEEICKHTYTHMNKQTYTYTYTYAYMYHVYIYIYMSLFMHISTRIAYHLTSNSQPLNPQFCIPKS